MSRSKVKRFPSAPGCCPLTVAEGNGKPRRGAIDCRLALSLLQAHSRHKSTVTADAWSLLSEPASATKTFFRIPPNRAIELGNQIQV